MRKKPPAKSVGRQATGHPTADAESTKASPRGPGIVGIGASAGGLEAFMLLLSNLAPDSVLAKGNIIRNRLKVFSTRANARAFVAIQREFGSFDAYVWRFVGGAPLRHRPKTMRDIPTTTAESDALSKDLKKRGMSFVGSTIIYAYMQAAGLIDDHIAGCFKAAR